MQYQLVLSLTLIVHQPRISYAHYSRVRVNLKYIVIVSRQNLIRHQSVHSNIKFVFSLNLHHYTSYNDLEQHSNRAGLYLKDVVIGCIFFYEVNADVLLEYGWVIILIDDIDCYHDSSSQTAIRGRHAELMSCYLLSV